MPKIESEEPVELLTWDPADGTEDDEDDDIEDELPADEAFDPDSIEDDDDLGEDVDEPVVVEEIAADGYKKDLPVSLPLDARAKSHPDLPRVKATAFKRFIK